VRVSNDWSADDPPHILGRNGKSIQLHLYYSV